MELGRNRVKYEGNYIFLKLWLRKQLTERKSSLRTGLSKLKIKLIVTKREVKSSPLQTWNVRGLRIIIKIHANTLHNFFILILDNVEEVNSLFSGLKSDATHKCKGSIQNNANQNTQVKYHLLGWYWAKTGMIDRQETSCIKYFQKTICIRNKE